MQEFDLDDFSVADSASNVIIENQLIDIPNKDYHARRDYISASMLKQLIKNPYLHFHPEDIEHSIHFDIGNAIHCLILEPHKFDNEFAIIPRKLDLRTTADKVFFNTFTEENENKTILRFEDGENCKAMAESTLQIPIVQALLQDCTFEKSIFKEVDIDIDGVSHRIKSKVRYDGGNEQKKMIIDVKSCEDSSPAAFKREIAKWYYHVQDAWYTKVLGYEEFVYIAVSKKPPYMVGIYRSIIGDRELGWDLCKKAIMLSFNPIDKKDKVWKDRDGLSIQTIALPAYAYYENENL